MKKTRLFPHLEPRQDETDGTNRTVESRDARLASFEKGQQVEQGHMPKKSKNKQKRKVKEGILLCSHWSCSIVATARFCSC